MNNTLTKLLTLASGLFLASPTAFSQTTFFDGTFDLSHWTVAHLSDDGTGTSTVIMQSSGGNTGNYLELTNYEGRGLLEDLQIFNSAVYNPSVSGAISSVSFSIDTSSFNFGNNQNIQPVLLQNGDYWITLPRLSHASTNSWSSLTFPNLDESSFAASLFHSSGIAPDFSSAGAPITFGFIAAISNYGVTSVIGVDNFSVTVSAIPEPSTYAALVGLAALGFAVWRNRANRGAKEKPAPMIP